MADGDVTWQFVGREVSEFALATSARKFDVSMPAARSKTSKNPSLASIAPSLLTSTVRKRIRVPRRAAEAAVASPETSMPPEFTEVADVAVSCAKLRPPADASVDRLLSELAVGHLMRLALVTATPPPLYVGFPLW